MSSKIKISEMDRISHRDMKWSFAIIVDNSSRKKICSLMLNNSNKKIEINGNVYDLQDTSVTSLTEFKRELVNMADSLLNN